MLSKAYTSVALLCSFGGWTTACTNAGAESATPPAPVVAALQSDAGAAQLPVEEIEKTIGAQGEESNGVLEIALARSDLGEVTGPHGVKLGPSFEIHGDLYFQPLRGDKALLNGDLALREDEVNPFIAALLGNGLVFQAFHQHLPTDPQIWFVHFRGEGEPLTLAKSARAAIAVTGTPLPQPSNDTPSTPLDADRLEQILHGSSTVGDDGVVTVSVTRKDRVLLAGSKVQPEAGVSTTIEWKPLSGEDADVVLDFSMTGSEVEPVVRHMLLDKGWYQGCLYNQETQERPQLYFDHMLKTGNAYALAREIREGLDLTAAQ